MPLAVRARNVMFARMIPEQRILDLARRLRDPLPGDEAKERLAPRPAGGRLHREPAPDARVAAVLMLLVPDEQGLTMPLILRPHVDGDVHSGQIALPGGGREGKESVEDTALREAQEEIGIEPSAVEILGRLSPQSIPVSNYVVHPVVGTCPERPGFRLDPVEVADAFWAPLDRLRLEQVEVRRSERAGVPFEMPGWPLPQGFLWGATAMMLAELIALVEPPGESAQRRKDESPTAR